MVFMKIVLEERVMIEKGFSWVRNCVQLQVTNAPNKRGFNKIFSYNMYPRHGQSIAGMTPSGSQAVLILVLLFNKLAPILRVDIQLQ